jgi:F0F1-type ATP synthase membrane subunit b/b'
MSDDRKGWGHTVLGWFIEKEGTLGEGEAAFEPAPASDPGAPGAVDAATPSASNPPAGPGPEVFQTPPPPPVAGNVDFDAVFDAAGIAAEERGQVERARDLLSNLPAETPAAVKKQIVAASLKAFGIPIERIIEATAQEIQALEGYIQTGAAQAESFRAEAEKKIATFEQEMKRIREAAESRIREQQGVVGACNAKKLEVQQILEFFGQETVAQVVRDSPKLQRPPEPTST